MERENHLIDSYTHSFILYSQVFIKSLLCDRACAYKDTKDTKMKKMYMSSCLSSLTIV